MKNKYVYMPLRLIDMRAFEDYINKMASDGYIFKETILGFCKFEVSDVSDVYFRVTYLRHVPNWYAEKKIRERTVLLDLMHDFDYEYVTDIEPMIVFKSNNPDKIYVDEAFDTDTFDQEIKRDIRKDFIVLLLSTISFIIITYFVMTLSEKDNVVMNMLLVVYIMLMMTRTVIRYVSNRKYLKDKKFNEFLKAPVLSELLLSLIFPVFITILSIDSAGYWINDSEMYYGYMKQQFIALGIVTLVIVPLYIYLYVKEQKRQKRYNITSDDNTTK